MSPLRPLTGAPLLTAAVGLLADDRSPQRDEQLDGTLAHTNPAQRTHR